jgi:hypothetical protein
VFSFPRSTLADDPAARWNVTRETPTGSTATRTTGNLVISQHFPIKATRKD